MKKRGSALLAVALMQASLASGLGMGDIQMHSAMDEPLDATIQLRGVGDLSPSQILVNLASEEDFERVGTERSFFLSAIDFEVQLDGGSGGVVRLSTRDVVREPYLDFVVEVRWPNGRVLREYTVLLDLPNYTPETVAPVAVPAASEPAQPIASTRAATAKRTAPAAPQGRATDWSGDRYGPVESRDTLWSIANQVRTDGVSAQRMMIGLQRENPSAFIGGNVNLIKAGYVLRIPDQQTLANISQQQALDELQEHNRAWRSGEPLNLTRERREPAVESVASEDDAYLRLAGDEASDSDAESGLGGEADGTAATDVLAAQENLAAAERENEELRARLEALESQVEDYQRLVELQSETANAVQQQAVSSEAEAESAKQPPPVEQPKPAPTSAPAAPEPGFFASMMQSTWTWVLAAILLIAGMVLALLRRRREQDDFEYAPVPAPRHAKPDTAPVASATIAEGGAPQTAEVQATDNDAADDGVPENATDVVAEAEIYIAYGRLEKARKMLEAAIVSEPDRGEARVKLMEVMVEEDDETGFLHQYAELERRGDNASLVEATNLVKAAGLGWLGERSASEELASGWETPANESSDLTELGESGEDVTFDGLADLELDEDLLLESEPAADEQTASEAVQDVPLASLDLDTAADIAPTGELELNEDFGLGLEEDDGLLVDDEPLGEFNLGADADPASLSDTSLASIDDENLLGDDNSIQTQLELAQAYLDMGDQEGAREILEEIRGKGTESQQRLAEELFASLAS